MKLPPTMPSTTPISTSTTRISISVMPRECRRRIVWSRIVFPSIRLAQFLRAKRQASRGLVPFLLHKFAHSHHTQQDGEHDAADHHGETEDQRGLENGEKA